jgi:hypothetical protein
MGGVARITVASSDDVDDPACDSFLIASVASERGDLTEP